MNSIATLRRLHRLPQMALALFVLAIAQTTLLPCAMSTTASMPHHCVHCPSSHNQLDTCATAFSADSIHSSNVHPLASALDVPLQVTFEVREFPLVRIAAHRDVIPPPVSRRLHLTHCVQLK